MACQMRRYGKNDFWQNRMTEKYIYGWPDQSIEDSQPTLKFQDKGLVAVDV